MVPLPGLIWVVVQLVILVEARIREFAHRSPELCVPSLVSSFSCTIGNRRQRQRQRALLTWFPGQIPRYVNKSLKLNQSVSAQSLSIYIYIYTHILRPPNRLPSKEERRFEVAKRPARGLGARVKSRPHAEDHGGHFSAALRGSTEPSVEKIGQVAVPCYE